MRSTTGSGPSWRANPSRTCGSTSRTATGPGRTPRRTPRPSPPRSTVTAAVADGTAPPYVGIRMKCMEAAVRDRGIRTLDLFLTTLLDGGALPDGLRPHPAQGHLPRADRRDGRLCEEFERAAGLPAGRLGFEIQIETTQAILGPDGTATVPRLIDAAAGPRQRPALRHLRLQRGLRGERRPPVAGPPGRRPRQGCHAGRRRGHRRTPSATAPPTCCPSAGPTRSTTPGGCTTA